MAAAVASVAGGVLNAGATTLGLNLAQNDLELTKEVFMQQMRQQKRLWAADWAESSWRHGEQCMQSAQQHAECYSLSAATFYQAEKIHRREIHQSFLSDMRQYVTGLPTQRAPGVP
jgi:hypothetical protein